MDEACAHEYRDPASRRFHAEPVACAACGPHYRLEDEDEPSGDGDDEEAIRRRRQPAPRRCGAGREGRRWIPPRLRRAERRGRRRGCASGSSGRSNRSPSWRATSATARSLVELSPEAEALLASAAAPIVLAPARVALAEVAPDNDELGVMLPYTPLHHLLFAAGAPDVLVMTSANRSSEPIAYEDDDAMERLAGIADGFLIGERPIARRVDDSVVRVRPARSDDPPARAAATPRARSPPCRSHRPILAVGADLKNTITLVVDGQAFVSQHIGDLDHYTACRAFEETDRTTCWRCTRCVATICWSCMTPIRSTARPRAPARSGGARTRRRAAPSRPRRLGARRARRRGTSRVLGVSFDGTGYGDDGAIWGGELFVGSVREGFERVAHLRAAPLAGGDAAARHPVQAAAGFLEQLPGLPDLTRPPFAFRCALSGRPPAARERDAGLRHDLGRPPVRHRGGAAGLHPADHVRGPGRDVGRAARSQGANRRAVSLPVRRRAGRLATAPARRHDRPSARPGPR